VPYLQISTNKTLNERAKKEARKHAEFIAFCFNNSDKIYTKCAPLLILLGAFKISVATGFALTIGLCVGSLTPYNRSCVELK
jgi:hypothetical protein